MAGDESASRISRRQIFAEIVVIFGVLFVQGAMPVPEVNEPYYLGKATHFWNPGWAQADLFLDSKDAHQAFYFTFGWLSLWLPLTVLAWFGRVLTWGLLAWAWRRLSFAVVPRRWFSVLSAALLVCLIERGHMAGEWLIGGVEAKGFAFVLVFLGLEALVLGHWSRVWPLLGAASAFHVLVGGWSVVAAGIAWLLLPGNRQPLRSMWPAILGGLLLSLPGLIPSLAMNRGVDGETVRQANQIYVYQRLYHHLDPAQLPPQYIVRFALLLLLWLTLCLRTPADSAMRRLQAYVAGAALIAAMGAAIAWLRYLDPALAARLLRFYWLRLADVIVPLGVALGSVSLIAWLLKVRPAWGRCALGAAVLVGVSHLSIHAIRLPIAAPPPAYRLSRRTSDFVAWRHACQWVADSESIPADARFITPRMAQTFKWYAGCGEVANWKEVPQDARAIVEWWQRTVNLHANSSSRPEQRWRDSLTELGTRRLKSLAEQYEADYVITAARPGLDLEVVYKNRSYTIYRLGNGR